MPNDTHTCPACGNSFADHELECPKCGAKVGEPVNGGKSDDALATTGDERPKNQVGMVVIVVLVLAAISFGIYKFGGFGDTEFDEERRQTLANLKQIANAVQSYQADWDGSYPPRFSSLRDLKRALSPYLSDETENPRAGSSESTQGLQLDGDGEPGDNDLTVEPVIESVFVSKNPSGSSLRPNSYLQRAGKDTFGDKDRTVLVFESEPWPDGGWCYAFTDGSVAYVTDRGELIMNPFGF